MEIAKITRDDLTDVEIKIETILDENDQETGCYGLYIADDYQGQVCFQPEDKYAWQFLSEKLTYREQNQIVVHIQTQI